MSLPSLPRSPERMQSEIKMRLKGADGVPGQGTTLYSKEEPWNTCVQLQKQTKTVYGQHKNFSVEKEKCLDEYSTSLINESSYG